MREIIAAAIGLSLALTVVGTAQAQQAPSFGLSGDEPISLDADNCDLQRAQDRAVCTGNVMVAQGPALLTADVMTVYFVPGTQAFRRLEGEGQLRYASGQDAISGREGTFDTDTATITVTGDVVVVQGEQVITGDRLVYNTETGALSFSAAPSGRVRGLFVPARDDAASD